ncbi:MAG: right-handed parallel beta-helix repeat-containing protein [Planctomycetia bacterium]|nr:right-handed parallel beta-helix repeat-containing protein [Planctomycetia bacterium]
MSRRHVLVISLFAVCFWGALSVVSPAQTPPQRVVASSFGFDPQDATDALQRAIDSGAKVVVVDRQQCAWNVRPISLRSDLTLLLEPGVEIIAKAGEFESLGDCLLRAQNAHNLTIKGAGSGATLKMRKREYWQEPYKKSEWRHGVSLLSCEHVVIEDLTIEETGGDGIYVGVASRGNPCRDITIRRVDCNENNRQGISVISVDGLLIEDSILRNTNGTAPEAGIDFEPNHPEEQISNVIMRRTQVYNNAGQGIAFYLPNLSNHGHELSWHVEDCQVVGNCREGMTLTVGSGENKLLSGNCVVSNCNFIGNGNGIATRSKWSKGAPLTIEKTRIITASAAQALGLDASFDFQPLEQYVQHKEKYRATTVNSGLSFVSVGTDVDRNGGVRLDDVVIIDANAEAPEFLFVLRDASNDGVGFENITGTIRAIKLDAQGQKASRNLLEVNDETIRAMFPALSARRAPLFDLARLNAPSDAALAHELADAWQARFKESKGERSVFRARGGAIYYFYATKGQTTQWTLRQRKIGQYTPQAVTLRLESPSGEVCQQWTMEPDLEARQFTASAPVEGWYRLVCECGASTIELTEDSTALLIAARPSFNVFGSRGNLQFYVPKQSDDLGVRVVGSADERVTARLYDPENKLVAEMKDVGEMAMWNFEQEQDNSAKPKSGFWRLELTAPEIGILEDYIVTIHGVPALLR